jgi:hypothetical protein
MAPDNLSLYPKANAPYDNLNLFVENPKAIHNIDLREKLHTLLFGDRAHPGQGKTVVVRTMNQVCPCVKEERGQKHREPDPTCSICQGEGYTFTDKPFTAWRSVIHSTAGPSTFMEELPGLTNIVGYNFIFEWDTPMRPIDKIIEVDLDQEGNLPAGGLKAADKLTYQYKKFKISQLIIYRADNGRVEFVRCVAEKEEW